MSDSTKVSPKAEAVYVKDKPRVLVALRAGWSMGHIARAYELPYRIIRHWRDEAGIAPAPAGGRGRPTPAVGEVLV